MTDNVVIFPKQSTQLQSLDQIIGAVEENRKEHVNYMMDDIMNFIYGMAVDAGFDIDQDDLFKDSILVTEAIQSLLLKAVGVYHPLQDITKELISIEREEGDGPVVA